MNEPVIITTASAQPVDPAWDDARRWVQIATRHECRKLLAQCMAGFELMALQKRFKIKRGNPKKEIRQIGVILFKDVIAKELPIPVRTAQRWMRMARAIKNELAKLALPKPVQAQLTGSSSCWLPEYSQQIVKFVDQITRGRTQSDLLTRSTRPRKPLKALAAPSMPAPTIEMLPSAPPRKSTPASRLAEDYSVTLPTDAKLLEEIEILEQVVLVCRQWLLTEWSQRDIAVVRARLGALRDAA